MMGLEEVRTRHDIIGAIDWEMTPEEAVTLYLEWGNNWSHGKHLIRSKNDISHYFVVNTWDEPAKIYLIERNCEAAKELAEIEMPTSLRQGFLKRIARRKGVYAIDEEVREWLEGKLYGPEKTDPAYRS